MSGYGCNINDYYMDTLPSPIRMDALLLRSLFDRIYVINLAARLDRRREIAGQLALVGLGLEDPLVRLFPAVRPEDAGDFPSVGARGCFLSHLAVLKDAVAQGHDSILIVEDDMDWEPRVLAQGADLRALVREDWCFLHGGVPSGRGAGGPVALRRLAAGEEKLLAHFIGLRGGAIPVAARYLEAILGRPAGSPEGGPMHVDGAYSWLRKDHPDMVACICEPPVALQRSSRSDIAEPTGWRSWGLTDLARRVLRPVRRRFGV